MGDITVIGPPADYRTTNSASVLCAACQLFPAACQVTTTVRSSHHHFFLRIMPGDPPWFLPGPPDSAVLRRDLRLRVPVRGCLHGLARLARSPRLLLLSNLILLNCSFSAIFCIK